MDLGTLNQKCGGQKDSAILAAGAPPFNEIAGLHRP
jgi:hypothetical protein